MATKRKSTARTSTARTAGRATRSTSAASRTRPAAASARKTSSKDRGKAQKSGPAPKPGRPTGKAPARPAAPVASSKRKPAVAAKVVKPAVAPKPVVRPLGVLPPQHQARTTHRSAPAAVVRPRQTAPMPAPPQETTPVTEPDLKDLEVRLLDERRRILKEMGHLETTVLKVNPRDSAGDLSGYSFHMADAGTDAMEREKAFLFASTEGRALMEINDALRRLYRGEYGACESCGQPIPRGRLEAVPHARLCIACKEKEERSQRSTT